MQNELLIFSQQVNSNADHKQIIIKSLNKETNKQLESLSSSWPFFSIKKRMLVEERRGMFNRKMKKKLIEKGV